MHETGVAFMRARMRSSASSWIAAKRSSRTAIER
jgi:hypothetical protein